ncbi:MAG: LysR family transcriptional regulator [Gammaproteobacteria bacterium]|nr:LysR family transcriptional regulator [Gammaproteobacteria bacterium]
MLYEAHFKNTVLSGPTNYYRMINLSTRLFSEKRSMHPLRLTLRQLQIFRVVADSGTTAAAAAAISLSQSATSAAINELERLLELQLFDRVGKRLQLNDNGRALLPQALASLDSAGWIERWALDRESQIGTLRIGASTTIGNYLLPAILAGFRDSLSEAARPNWHVQVAIANTAVIARQVAAFELDLGLIEGPCHEAELTVLPWLEDDLVVVAAARDPILPRTRKRPVSLAALRQATWLLREEGSGTREIINQLLIPHLHHLRPGIQFGNPEAIKRAAASGLGITCLSRCVVEDLLNSGVLVAPPTELPQLTRRFYLVMHEKKQRTHGLDLLIAHLAAVPAQRNVTGF